MNEKMRLFAMGLAVAVLGLLATVAAIGGFADRRGVIASTDLVSAEGVLQELSADRQSFQFLDETPAAEDALRQVFGLTQADGATSRNMLLSCRLTSNLAGFSGFLQAGAHYRIHFLQGRTPYEVVRIQPIVAPIVSAQEIAE